MIRSRAACVSRIAVLAAGLGLCWTSGSAAKSKPLPYSVKLDVTYGWVGSATYREEVEGRLLLDLRHAGCYESWERSADAESDLILRISLADLLEEAVYESTLADRAKQFGRPEAADAYVARLEVSVELALIDADLDATVMNKRFRLVNSYRPRFDEDASFAVREQSVADLTRNIVMFACKPNEKKLAKLLSRAREEGGAASGSAR